MPVEDEVVTVERKGSVGLVTLNRPENLNAANRALHTRIAEVWRELDTDPDLHAVVLTGAGRAFSAGGDSGLLLAMTDDEQLRDEVLAEAEEVIRGMLALSVPIIAAVNGPAVGLGFSLATSCDLVVMGESAFFSDPHVPFGLVAGDGGAITLPLIVGLLKAKEFVLLGERIDATESKRLGLANRVVPDESVVDDAMELAERLASFPPQAVAATKTALNRGLSAMVESVLSDLIAAESLSFVSPEFRRNLARVVK